MRTSSRTNLRLLLLGFAAFITNISYLCECHPQRGDVDNIMEYETELDVPVMQSEQHWALLSQIGQVLNHIADAAKEKSQIKSDMAEAVNALTSTILASNIRLDNQIISLRRDTNSQMDAALRAAKNNEKQIQTMLQEAQDTQSVAENMYQSVMGFKESVMEQVHGSLPQGYNITESSDTSVPKGTSASVVESLLLCPDQYVGVGRKCYRMEVEHSKNWFEAREICQQEGSDLAMPDDLNILKSFLYEDANYNGVDFWLGASDLDEEENWRWISGKGMQPDWDEDQPDGGNRENCLEIRPGLELRLHDYYCYNKQNFICQSDIGPFTNTKETPALACPEGYFQLETQCFHVVDNQIRQWQDARSFCRDQGGDLAQPNDQQALRHVLLTNNLYNVWIGASRSLGIDKNWTWVSGEEMTEWVEEDDMNEYDYDNNKEFCLLMKTDFRPFFQSFPCDESQSFVCQRSARPIDEYIIADNSIMQDGNWSPVKNACIKSNNYEIYTTSTIEICKEKCVAEDDIQCQSIEYNLASHTCSISEARSNSDDYSEPCHVDGWEYMERRHLDMT